MCEPITIPAEIGTPSPNAHVRGHRHISLRLTQAEFNSLSSVAAQRGVTPSRLAETWVYLALVDQMEGQA